MKQIVNKFLADIKSTVISTLSNQNLLSKKYDNLFKDLENFLKKDEKNIFLLFDIVAYSYLYEKDISLNDNNIPQALLDIINNKLKDLKSVKQCTSKSKKLLIDYTMKKVRALFIGIFDKYHRVKIMLPKNDDENSLLIILLVEYVYRHHLIMEMGKMVKDNITQSVKRCASTIIKKEDNGRENKTMSKVKN